MGHPALPIFLALVASLCRLGGAETRGTLGNLTGSKLSIHTSMGPDSWQIVQNGRPRLIKLLDSFGGAAQIKEYVPGIQIIGRIYLADQPIDGDPTAAAEAWWNEVSSTILQYPAVDYWEGYNEPDVSTVDLIAWIAAFDVARIKILASHNLKACIASFSVGTPDVTTPEIVEAYYPAIDAAIANGGILGLHEYNGYFMNYTFSGTLQNGTGWFAGRYRMLYNQYLIPTGRVIPVAITELGATCVDTVHCTVEGGWKQLCGWWASNGLSSDCNLAYLSQLAWYDSIMQFDTYMLGATIFSLEIGGWDDFDIGPLTPDLIAYMNNS